MKTRAIVAKPSALRTKLFSIVMVIMILVPMIAPATPSFAAGIDDIPIAVTGRVLTPDKTGDTSDWVEIAVSGDYSLIVRKDFININTYAGTNNILGYQHTDFGPTTSYANSNVRTKINSWFNGTAAGAADNLPAGARLRNFTVQNTALSAIGTSCEQVSLSDGYSKPTGSKASTGNDIAFALSYTESAQFLSVYHFMRGPFANPPSSDEAAANYLKVNVPDVYAYCMWLRSPGDLPYTVASLGPNQGAYIGRVFQNYIASGGYYTYGFVFPALWVDSAIFDTPKPPIVIVDPVCVATVRYLDAATGSPLAPDDQFKGEPGEDYFCPPQDIRFYNPGILAPYSDPASGTFLHFGQELTITYLYTRGVATVIIIYLDLTTYSILDLDVYTIPAGDYGPLDLGLRVFPGYGVGTPLPGNPPITGIVDVGDVLVFYFGYQKMAVYAY